ncbi:unnamed protein product [Brachionus calyciflorus]|uniref:SLED domain-containing protein n=1 Tax=Brachionus calyciflorus TaxID=104777 RepID=A0A813PUP2_9BILA|nr:unnamed protein product [Brachionus calyciflorus]
MKTYGETNSNNDEINCHQKYLNLRKLNSNRAEKMKYLAKPRHETNLNEFLNYFNLVEVKQSNKMVSLEPNITVNDCQNKLEQLEKSKIDTALDPLTPIPTQILNIPKITFKKITNSNCLFEYMTKLGALVVPNESFQHIQTFLKQNSNSPSQKFELVYYLDKFYWPVRVKKFFNNNLYLLKFLKMNDDLNDSNDSNLSLNIQDISSVQIIFPLDSSQILVNNLRQIGTCKKKGIVIKKPDLSPEALGFENLISKLQLNKNIDNLKIDNFFKETFCHDSKIIEIIEYDKILFGKILENCSGRYKISILGQEEIFYIFNTDVYLRQFGWSKRTNFILENFEHLCEEYKANYEQVKFERADSLDENLPIRKNYLLEVLHENKFYVGCVQEVCNNEFLKVKLDSKEKHLNNLQLTFFIDFKQRTKNTSFIYPCGWCRKNNLILQEPSDWCPGDKFDWEMYVKLKSKEIQFYLSGQNFSVLSPRSNTSLNLCIQNQNEMFQLGQYLEVSLSKRDKWIYLGKIKAKLGNLLFIKIYSNKLIESNKLYIFTNDSTYLYPIGWCQINNYEYFDNSFLFIKPSFVSVDCSSYNNYFHPSFLQFVKSDEDYCSKIYLNKSISNCGPFFLKTKLESFPEYYGPGPIFLVIFKLLQNLINLSEKPFKLLKILHKNSKNLQNSDSTFSSSTSSSSSTESNFRKIRLKAKDKGKYLFKDVEICSTRSQVKEFLNELCVKLKCCTQMITLNEPLKESKDVYLEANRNLVNRINCCFLCTLNYFSLHNHASKQTEESKQNDEPPIKQRVKNNFKKIKPENQVQSSPIKTRLTTKMQTFFDNIRQIKKVERKEVFKEEDECSQSDDEPLTKKTKKLNQQLSQSTSCLGKNESTSPKKDLNTTLPCSLNSPNNLITSSKINTNNHNVNIPTNNSSNNLTMNVNSNPILWNKKEVEQYLLDNKFDSNLVHLIEEHEIDGQSFLMLNLPTIQNYMNLKLGPAIKLAHLVEKLKVFYFEKYQKRE